MTSTTSAGRKGKKSGTTSRASSARKSRAGAQEKPGTKAHATKGRTRVTAVAKAEEQGMHLHTAHPSIPVPYLTKDDLSANVRAAESALPAIKLPPPDRLALYGGLGALAVAGAVEWPVAAAIGVATAVARRGLRREDD